MDQFLKFWKVLPKLRALYTMKNQILKIYLYVCHLVRPTNIRNMAPEISHNKDDCVVDV